MRQPAWRRYARLWGEDVRADVDDEIEFHIQTRADRYVAQGMDEAAARVRAKREFGDMQRAKRECQAIGEDRTRARRRAELRSLVAGDVWHALRLLRRDPLFTAATVLTLALGIGAVTTLYTVFDAVLLRPLPFAQPDRLVQIWEERPTEDFGTNDIPTSVLNYRGWAEATSFEGAGAFRFAEHTLTGLSEAEQIAAVHVTPSLLRVLGVEPRLGRLFLDDEARPGVARPILISHGMWQRRFGGTGGVIGRAVTLDGEPREIVGVLPAEFAFPYAQMYPLVRRSRVEVFAPLVLEFMSPRGRSLGVVARLTPGANLAGAQREVASIHQGVGEANPGLNQGWSVRVVPLAEQVAGAVRLELAVLFSAVLLLLVIACANVGNLALARGLARYRELTIRTALGASRSRIARQLVTEAIVLALVSGVAGLLLSWIATRGLVQLVPFSFPRLGEIDTDIRAAAVALGASVIAGLLFGSLPAMKANRIDLRHALQGTARVAGGDRRSRTLANSLIALQVAMAVLLLIGAGLLVRSYVELTSLRPGFDTRHLVVGSVSLPETRYPEAHQQRLAYAAMLERVQAVPGVANVAFSGLMPFTDQEDFEGLEIEGAPPPDPGIAPSVRYYVVTPGYFNTVGVPIRAGRTLSEADGTDGLPVAVISEVAAHRFWPNDDPLGKRISVDGQTWRTIVGVAGSVRYSGLDAEPQAEVYVPAAQAQWPRMLLVVRTERTAETIVAELRSALAAVDADVPLSGVSTMETLVAESLKQRRLNMLLLSGFGSIAALLCAIGLYGVMGQAVISRRAEIGVRLALGASPWATVRLVLAEGLQTIAIGVALGVAAALVGTRILGTMLYGVTPLDPLTFLSVLLLVVLVALAAGAAPAIRAMRVDPLTTLRES